MPDVNGRPNPVNPHVIPGQPPHGAETTPTPSGGKICDICGQPV
jgi:hypothetical protein